MDQLSFASLDFAAKKKRTKRDVFLGRDGNGGAVGSARRRDRAALSQDRPARRSAAVPAGCHAAHLLPAAVVQSLRSRRGGSALRHPVHARVLRPRARPRRDPRRDDDPQLPSPAGTARSDESRVRGRRRAPGSTRRTAARRHDRGRDADRGLAVDEEPRGQARSRDAFLQEGQPVVLRHEGARRRGCRERARAHRGRDDGQRPRRQGDAPPDPRGRPRGVRRQGLCQRCEASGRPRRPASNGR